VAEYRVVIGDAARDLLRKPGVVFTCRGYQFRTVGNDLLECWATTGEYGSEVTPSLLAMNALKRWPR
jgi:hypothetical protein